MDASVSLGEWPARAGLINVLTGAGISTDSGAGLVIVNGRPTPDDGVADAVPRSPIGEILPRPVDNVVVGPAAGK